ncbi:cell envelope biogenesis protein OmpA [Leptospira fluminis]|uniref:Cell envelope biogenesis protein OmpA n=1 Tax=Leptospira fluminis TaxID=2484979 RepID=A0A4R9GN11_9LEPT|nr:cell envelope biogenesis protein OmpA [Leptospira fluminis]TGK17887.1 cell envelope biogenesis protein OmpA [Leptospira fluminis]
MIRIFLVLSFVLTFSGLKANSLIGTETTTFSPNWDGSVDFLKFKIRSSTLPKLQDWELTIRNASGETVKKYEANRLKKKDFSLFWDENEFAPEEVSIPEVLEWNGEDENGNIVPDGYYTYQLLLLTANQEKILSEEATIYLDSHPPKAETGIRNRLLLFEDRNHARIQIQQKGSGDSADLFTGEFLDYHGKLVKSYTWRTKDLPSVLSWDGTDSNGKNLAPGLYSYRLIARDPAGNESVSKQENISLQTESVGADINADTESYSTDSSVALSRIRFSSFLSSKLKSDSYEWEIFKRKGETESQIYVGKGLGEPPAEWTWEPKDKESRPLSSGTYFVRITIFSRYDRYSSFPKKFVLTEDRAKFSSDVFPNGFTPDGNWRKDFLEVRIRSKELPLSGWKITILESFGDSERVARTWTGTGSPPPRLVWSGKDEQGRRIGSLAPIKVVLSYKDMFGREGEEIIGNVSSGILVVKEKDGYRISVPERLYETRWWTVPSALKSLLGKLPGYKVELQYHTSHLGDDEYNLKLSEEKARKTFQSFFGKDYEFGRYRFRGYGETEPLIHGNGAYETDRNQRIDFFLSVGK